MRSQLLLFGVSVLILASACSANYKSIHRSTQYGKSGKAIHLDAKQRVVLTKSAPGKEQITKTTTNSTQVKEHLTEKTLETVETVKTKDEILVACAEPSPDALSALSASLGVELSKKNAEEVSKFLQFTSDTTETVENIGLRTQSIQLMRDALYRVCEAYYSGALSKHIVGILHERYQDIIVAVLAIEQLTGAVARMGTDRSSDGKTEYMVEEIVLSVLETRDNGKFLKGEEGKKEIARDEVEEIVETVRVSVLSALKAVTSESYAGKIAEEVKSRLSSVLNGLQIKNDENPLEDEDKIKEIAETVKKHLLPILRIGRTDGISAGGHPVTGEVAEAVKDIIASVYDKDHVVDGCILFLGTDNVYFDPENKMIRRTGEFCLDYLKRNDRRSLERDIRRKCLDFRSDNAEREEICAKLIDYLKAVETNYVRSQCVEFLVSKETYKGCTRETCEQKAREGVKGSEKSCEKKTCEDNVEEIKKTINSCRKYLDVNFVPRN